MRHAGRTAVITGGAMGIGQEYARRLASEGARIVVADVACADDTIRLVAEAGSGGLAVACDVSSPEDVASLHEAVDDFGGADILVHNAAIFPSNPLERFADVTFEAWTRIISVNLGSMFLLCKAFLPTMIEQRWGRIVGIASSLFHDTAPGSLAYVASKGGIIGFVRSLAAEAGEFGVTVNAISPGLTSSHGTEAGAHRELGLFEVVASAQAIKRTGTPSDLAGALSFLVSEDASWMTGQTLLVDGGSGNL